MVVVKRRDVDMRVAVERAELVVAEVERQGEGESVDRVAYSAQPAIQRAMQRAIQRGECESIHRLAIRQGKGIGRNRSDHAIKSTHGCEYANKRGARCDRIE